MLVSFICRMYIKKASCSNICVSHNSLHSLDLLSCQPPHLMRSRLVRELASKEKKINKTKEGQLDCPMASTCTHHFTHTYTRPCMHEQEHVHTPGLVFGLCSHYMMAGECLFFLSFCTSCTEADIPWHSIEQVQDEWFKSGDRHGQLSMASWHKTM